MLHVKGAANSFDLLIGEGEQTAELRQRNDRHLSVGNLSLGRMRAENGHLHEQKREEREEKEERKSQKERSALSECREGASLLIKVSSSSSVLTSCGRVRERERDEPQVARLQQQATKR